MALIFRLIKQIRVYSTNVSGALLFSTNFVVNFASLALCHALLIEYNTILYFQLILY